MGFIIVSLFAAAILGVSALGVFTLTRGDQHARCEHYSLLCT
jgi:hypothetical protein